MSHTHELKGLHGENPAGFLAALGLLRTLDKAEVDLQPRLRWKWEGGLIPVLTLNHSLSREDLVSLLHRQLGQSANLKTWGLEANLNLEPGAPRAFVESVTNSQWEQHELALFAGLGLETGLADPSFLRSPFVNLNGGGRQDFLPTCKNLVNSITLDELDSAIFEPWAYADRGNSRILHWDPDNERQHALQWEKPDSSNNGTVAGAGRLGIEALPLFPCLPSLPSRGVQVSMKYRDPRYLTCPCFCNQGAGRSTQVFFFWPLWTSSLNLNATQSLLWSIDGPRIRSGQCHAELRERGIAIVLASERTSERAGAYFNPSHPWWVASA